MKNVRHLFKVSILAVIIVLSCLGAAQAFNPQPEPPKSIPIGLAEDQTARITVALPPDSIGRTGAVKVRMAIFDMTGEMRKVVDAAVGPGQAISMDLSSADLRIFDGERMQLYAIVEILGGTEARVKGAQGIRAGFEIFDTTTGRTSAVVAADITIVPTLKNAQ